MCWFNLHAKDLAIREKSGVKWRKQPGYVFSFCSHILNSVSLNMRFEVHIALLLEIQVFWDVTLCCWLSSLGLLNPEDENITTF